MPRIIKAPNDLRRERSAEYTAAESTRLKAQLDYVAMMAEVDLPEGEVDLPEGEVGLPEGEVELPEEVGNESKVLEG